MKPASLVSAVCGAMLFVAGALAGAASCTPEHITVAKSVAAPVVKGACILLRAITDDGIAWDICATAEELAPLVPELLEERAAAPKEPDAGVVVPTLAFALEVPSRRFPRRHCTAWQKVGSDAGFRDGAEQGAGSGGAFDGGGDQGRGSGARSDGGREQIDGGK